MSFLPWLNKVYPILILFSSSRWFERQKHDSRLAKFCNFYLEGLFWVGVCSLSLRSTRSL